MPGELSYPGGREAELQWDGWCEEGRSSLGFWTKLDSVPPNSHPSQNLRIGPYHKEGSWPCDGRGRDWSLITQPPEARREAWDRFSLCCCSFAKLCRTLCNPMNYSTPGSSVLLSLGVCSDSCPLSWVMPSNHLILCCPLLLLPSIFPSVKVFSSEEALCIRWPKYWSFSFSISPSHEYSGLISFMIDWLDLLAIQGTLPLNPQEKNQPCTQLDLGLLISRTKRGYISVVLSHPVCGTLLEQP